MYKILRWLNFKLAPNLDHVSKLQNGSLFQTLNLSDLKLWDGPEFETFNTSIECSFRILSHLRNSVSAKVSHLEVLTRDQDFEPILSEAISKSHAYDLMGNIIPSITFWAISS